MMTSSSKSSSAVAASWSRGASSVCACRIGRRRSGLVRPRVLGRSRRRGDARSLARAEPVASSGDRGRAPSAPGRRRRHVGSSGSAVARRALGDLVGRVRRSSPRRREGRSELVRVRRRVAPAGRRRPRRRPASSADAARERRAGGVPRRAVARPLGGRLVDDGLRVRSGLDAAASAAPTAPTLRRGASAARRPRAPRRAPAS